ncbi:group 1 truncated hemoglobin [Exilibacterium tricleocarpae]|uniref:Group 1 truncated hemoglobin n=1 Tax=Exilibacterium tricleocarpae TaxID=2591008 RepID=A0A545SMT2_9GAMM|nr:group 1 truncated hemoglobin [Exilibacterium tricleocarpae]TQV66298.1 group 1 truncated hemoglobin [Exilibacterium tricleocarpae]
MSLYEKLGGEPAIKAVVEKFYEKVLVDTRICHLFDNTDMERQLEKQKAFLTLAFGGPNNYTGKDLREAHKHLDLSDMHFDAVSECLQATLEEVDAGEREKGEVMAIVKSVRPHVLNR